MTKRNDRKNASVLFVDDDASLRRVMQLEIERMGYDVTVAGDVAGAREAIGKKDFDVVILDLRMPKVSGDEYLVELKKDSPWSEVIVLTGNANIDVAIECMKKGAYDFLTKPCSLDQLEILIEKACEKRRLVTQFESLQPRAFAGVGIGNSPSFQRIKEMVVKVAPTGEPILILGENGTGKELLAREIVRYCKRTDRPFVTVNCSAFSESLLEAELFGHERGAFTGADRRRIGVFELADGGTIFLDEIGDMPASMQAKLLRTLQSGEVRPVGAEKNIYVDVRLISATNQDLPRLVEDGGFRRDLYHRLNTFTLELPPLRDRGEDIVELAEHFLAEQSRRIERRLSFSAETLETLKAYPWPGNVRELQNVVKRASILAPGDVIAPDSLPEHLNQPLRASEGEMDITKMSAEELEEIHIVKMIQACGGNKREAARRLKISNKTLYNKLHAFGIDLDEVASHA